LRLFLFGPGYVGRAFAKRLAADGWRVAAGARDDPGAALLKAEGIDPVDLADSATLEAAFGSDAVLVTAPPDQRGCPAMAAIGAASPGWLGYLSSTGVYGDRGGGWVFEDSPLNALSIEGARRVAAEHAWRLHARRVGLVVSMFRLPGIYGPGRSAFDRVRAGTARRIVRQGQVFSRVHVDDIATALRASLARPAAGRIYNVCDDEPCAPQDVIAEAARLLGVAPPPEEPFGTAAVAPGSRRFFTESKRVSNARAKAELGWRPAYPSYREGLRAILAAEAR
jgi:nucleoside-diphosphate-sugar epimerase